MNGELHCRSCGRPMAPRRSWRDRAQEVRYCSRACRTRRVGSVDRALETSILSLLEARAGGASICPGEAARAVAGSADWRALMEPARRAARRLTHAGRVQILQRGQVVDPGGFRGPIRIRRAP